MNLENELGALQRQRNKLADEITATTNNLLAQRQQKLTELETQATNRLAATKQDLLQAGEALEHATRDLVEPRAELAGLTSQIELLSRRKTDLKAEIALEVTSLEETRAAKASADGQLQYVEDILAPLKAQIPTLTSKKEQIERDIIGLEQRFKALDDEFEAKEQAILQEVRMLLAKKDDLTIWIQDRQKEFDEAGRLIGERQRAQDERDNNLRVREARVAQDARMVARNASLLEL